MMRLRVRLQLWLQLRLPTGPVEMMVEVRRNYVGVGATEVGLSFSEGQERAVAAMVVAIFQADAENDPAARPSIPQRLPLDGGAIDDAAMEDAVA